MFFISTPLSGVCPDCCVRSGSSVADALDRATTGIGRDRLSYYRYVHSGDIAARCQCSQTDVSGRSLLSSLHSPPYTCIYEFNSAWSFTAFVSIRGRTNSCDNSFFPVILAALAFLLTETCGCQFYTRCLHHVPFVFHCKWYALWCCSYVLCWLFFANFLHLDVNFITWGASLLIWWLWVTIDSCRTGFCDGFSYLRSLMFPVNDKIP
jgi:hypothetical protein